MEQQTVIILDADIVAYQMAASNETKTNWGDGLTTYYSNTEQCESALEDRIDYLKEKLGATKVICALSDSVNFRKEFYPEYKQNRADLHRPEHLGHLRDYLKSHYEVVMKPGLEADDVCGILATADIEKLIGMKKVIVSIDKDFETIPCWLFNPNKDEEPRNIYKEEADWNFYIQVLTGDRTDNYKGCPGIGPVKAKAILPEKGAPESEMWKAVVETFESKKLTKEDALINARCARILRAEDYDFKTGTVKLWEPRV